MSTEEMEDSKKTLRKPTAETGHARNIGSFEKLIALLETYSDRYQPSNEAINLKNLYQKLEEAKAALALTADTRTAYHNAENERSAIFRPLKRFSTRLLNAFACCGVSELAINDAITINRKLQGSRAPASTQRKQAIEAGSEEGTISSASQQSIDNRIAHFKAMRILFSTHHQYNPNEEDLRLDSLYQLEERMLQTNTACIKAASAFGRSRHTRDLSLYHSQNGLVALAHTAKRYAKSMLGASSAAYQQIHKIPFRSRVKLG